MTNREWLLSLPSKEMAQHLGVKPCLSCAKDMFKALVPKVMTRDDFFLNVGTCDGNCIEGARLWLELPHEE